MEDGIIGVMEALNELKNDNTVPRNVKTKIESIIILLNEKSEVSCVESRNHFFA